ncbi:MAG: multidrug efflux pump [Gammaproteobacteria bacterium]|jgi:multidrug efflux pump
MWLSDTSVKRPVFASVLSLLLMVLGMLAFTQLSVREYPNISPPVVSINTEYSGASADIVESRITQVLEGEISGIAGVNNITSTSRDGRSSITVEFDLDRDLDNATNDLRDKVSSVQRRLPDDAEVPRISKRDADSRPILWMSLEITNGMSMMDATDYVDRYIVDRFSVITGVSQVNYLNTARPSMRIWLDRLLLAARDLTVTDIQNALRRENIELPAGRLESRDKEFVARIARNYETAEDFSALVIKRGEDGHFIRLGEVSTVEVAERDPRVIFRTNGSDMVGIGIIKQSTANTLEVLDAVKEEVTRVNAELPDGMTLIYSSDDSLFIREAINNVYQTIAIATVLVGLVILIFLGSFRAMFIPLITIPICLVSAFSILAIFDFSVNLITLLALVLSIGLVVDDSIVVLENIHRRIEKGEQPLLAAFKGVRQVAFAVIATTIVLVAVFIPIVFLKDNVGRIFSELAVTVAAAVIFSSVLALSLVPMLSSKLLKPVAEEGVVIRFVDNIFNKITDIYQLVLEKNLRNSWISIVFMVVIGICAFKLFNIIPTEYAPNEDQGMFRANIIASEGTSFTRIHDQLLPQLEQPILPYVESGELQRGLFRFPGFNGNTNSGMAMMALSPRSERESSSDEIMQAISAEWKKIPGVRVFVSKRSGLSRRGGGSPVQFVLGGSTYDELAAWRDIILQRAQEYPGLTQINSDLKETQPQVLVRINKNRAAELGVSIETIGRTLSTMMTEQQVTTYIVDGEEYDVVLQAKDEQRATPDDMSNIFVRSDRTGMLIPLTNLTVIDNTAGPGVLNRYNRYRAMTISANLTQGYSLGDALVFLEGVVKEELPQGAHIDYKGQSLEFKEASGSMMFTFAIALLVVYLVLAAQFESFVHPLVILITVPMAMVGALIGLALTDGTMNIYSQIGMVMLVGIAAKNGILIVEFINQLRDKGLSFSEAIIQGARIRFRPVVMTTISTSIGAVPLILASGAGSESRSVLGVVIFSGITFASIFTLFVVPVFYQLLAKGTRSRNAVEQRLENLITQTK